MPVTGIPVITAPEADLGVIYPKTSTLFGQLLTTRKRGFLLRRGTAATMEFSFMDNGCSISWERDEGSENVFGDVEVRFREAVLLDKRLVGAVPATIVSVEDGTVRVPIPTAVRDRSGVYLVDAGILNSKKELLFSNEFYLYVEGSAWKTNSGLLGPPSMDDIRLSLRDSDPLENELLGANDFAAVELSYAAVRSVQMWNETSPVIRSLARSTYNFHHRDLWLLGIHTFLFELATEHYRRNSLQYNAGGIAVDDKNKSREYDAAFIQRYQRFKDQIVSLKVQANLNRGYGSI